MLAPEKDINAIFADGHAIDEAIREARRQVLRRHRLIGQPLIVWREGAVRLASPDEAEEGIRAA